MRAHGSANAGLAAGRHGWDSMSESLIPSVQVPSPGRSPIKAITLDPPLGNWASSSEEIANGCIPPVHLAEKILVCSGAFIARSESVDAADVIGGTCGHDPQRLLGPLPAQLSSVRPGAIWLWAKGSVLRDARVQGANLGQPGLATVLRRAPVCADVVRSARPASSVCQSKGACESRVSTGRGWGSDRAPGNGSLSLWRRRPLPRKNARRNSRSRDPARALAHPHSLVRAPAEPPRFWVYFGVDSISEVGILY
jgi:hypothetical protein